MDREGRFWLCFWAMVLTALAIMSVAGTIWFKISHETEKAELDACVAAHHEWKPMMLPGTTGTFMSCVDPNH